MKRLAAFVALLFTVLTVPVPATAAPNFAAEIVALTPSLPQPGDTISVDVQLSNPSSIGIAGLQARFLVSTSPLYGRSQIAQVLAGSTLPTYRLVEPAAASGIDLASGASTTITLRATPKQLGLANARAGAYVFGVQLDGTVAGKSVTERRITFLPWMPDKANSRLGVVTVWTLTAPPSLGVDGAFIDDSLARSVSADGKLRLQLDAMKSVPKAVWLVDPVLAESVQSLANGARITNDDGSIRATSDAEMAAAQQWLTDLRAATATGTLAALPMADLDIRAAFKFARLSILRSALIQASARLGAVMQVSEVPLIVPLYGGAVTDSSWKFLHSIGAVAAVVSDVGYPAQQTQYTPTSAIAVNDFARPVIASDHLTSSTPATRGLSAAATRQAFAAQLLMSYLERPNSERVLTIAVPPTWMPSADAPIADVLNAPWIAHSTIRQATAAGTDGRNTNITVATHGQRLQNVDLGRAVDQQRALAHLTGDEAFTATVNDAVLGTLSRWFTAREVPDRYSALTNAKLKALAESVRVVTRGEIVFGAEKGVVPVTVANGLPVAIDITLRATGYPSVRVQPTEFTDIHLNAGKRVSVEVSTRVTGSGDAYLGLQLEGRDRSAVDGPVLLTVRSAAYARVASYLVLGAFVLLLMLVAVNTVKRIRNRGQGEVDA